MDQDDLGVVIQPLASSQSRQSIFILPVHFQIIRIPTIISVLNLYEKLAAKKKKDERSSYYDSALLRKEVLWLLYCKTKSNLVSPVVVKLCLPQARIKSPFDYVG